MLKYIITLIILAIIYSIFSDWDYERELYKNSGLKKEDYWKKNIKNAPYFQKTVQGRSRGNEY